MNKQGKVVLKYDTLGFIEYDIDNRISYEVKDYPLFNIGDEINFSIIQRKIRGTDKSVERAVNLVVAEIEKAASSSELLLLGERGDVIETNIIDIIKPSAIVLNFYNQKAILPLQNISWNFAVSQKLFNSYKIGQRTKIVILSNTPGEPLIVSKKHLTPLPSEKETWQKLKVGDILSGKIIEVLNKEVVLGFTHGLSGLASIPDNFNKTIGDKIEVQVISKSLDRFLLNTTFHFEHPISQNIKVEENEDSLVNREINFLHSDESLRDAHSFFHSLYFDFCEESVENNEKKFFQEAFKNNSNLFDLAISVELPLYIQFTSKSWEGDFNKKLIPYLYNVSIEKDADLKALKYLSEQKYWININTSSEGKNYWTLFNEELYLSGFVTEEPDERFLFISKIAIGRKDKDSTYYKEKSQQSGHFLYESEIIFLGLYSNRPIDKPFSRVFELLQEKSDAFSLYGELKKKTGALLMEEGESLKIFDKFLEYQENLEKEKSKENAVKVAGPFSRIPSSSGEISIQVAANSFLQEVFENSETDFVFVSIKTSEKSTKEKGNGKELVWFDDADFEVINDRAIFHFADLDKSLSALEGGFFVEPKISFKQWQVQRKVIQDFFDKKIDLRHIETLFIKPEKIAPPKTLTFQFHNEILNETRITNPNNNQVKAVSKAVGNENIFLIQGPPGTGKTTVIAELVQQLVKKGERVLVTSQTHIAVDNVLEKLKKLNNLTLVRFGNIKKVAPGLEMFHIENQVELLASQYSKVVSNNIQLLEEKLKFSNLSNEQTERKLLLNLEIISESYPPQFREQLISSNKDFISSIVNLNEKQLKPIITVLQNWQENINSHLEEIARPIIYSAINVGFATCIGVRTDRGLSERETKFDTVIIDEAGKANLSESIAAVSMAKKVILVGDHMQLPPYIDASLIDDRDSTSFPRSKKFNNNQFPLDSIKHALTTSLFEFLINKNKAGLFPSSNIELLNYQHRMHPDIGEFISKVFYGGNVKMGESTVKNILRNPPPFDKQIIFIDTGKSRNPFESINGISFKNDTEASCISEIIVPRLIEDGVSKTNFAVIAPYKAQVANISEKLKMNNISNVEISTLDSFQGMEFDVIVFSFTRSAKNKKVGFLDDVRRLNVAFSRAKKKLILVGNSKTLTDKSCHFDGVFNYTKMYRDLIGLSKDEKKGSFIDINNLEKDTGFNDLIKQNIKRGGEYECLFQESIPFKDDQIHIFLVKGLVEGKLYDKGRTHFFEKNQKIKLSIKKLDIQKKEIFLENKIKVKALQLKFFKEKKIGDVIECHFENSVINLGHFFKIHEDFHGLIYDPTLSKNGFIKSKEYTLIIERMDSINKRVSLKIK